MLFSFQRNCLTWSLSKLNLLNVSFLWLLVKGMVLRNLTKFSSKIAKQLGCMNPDWSQLLKVQIILTISNRWVLRMVSLLQVSIIEPGAQHFILSRHWAITVSLTDIRLKYFTPLELSNLFVWNLIMLSYHLDKHFQWNEVSEFVASTWYKSLIYQILLKSKQ